MPPVLFVILAAIWLVVFFVVRRRVMRAMLEGRLSTVRGAAALAGLWAMVPLIYLAWQTYQLPLVLGVSLLVFVVFFVMTVFFFRAMGEGPIL